MVPTMFIRLMKLPEDVRRKYDVSSLRHVIHAAAPCPADVKRAMIEWWGPVIYEFYGSTESGAVTFATSEDALKKPGTVGKISPGAELRFIGDDGKVLPQGEIGEIYSRIAGNPDFTYHNKPEKRAEIDRDGFITSGDVGYIDAGRLRLHLRPQARHGDLGRRQHLSGRNRGGAACRSRRARLRGVRHSRRGIRRGADGGGGAAGRRHARCRRHPRAAEDLAGRLQGAEAHRNPEPTCRARIPARSSSAACAIPIGSGRGGGFEQAVVPASAGTQTPISDRQGGLRRDSGGYGSAFAGTTRRRRPSS